MRQRHPLTRQPLAVLAGPCNDPCASKPFCGGDEIIRARKDPLDHTDRSCEVIRKYARMSVDNVLAGLAK